MSLHLKTLKLSFFLNDKLKLIIFLFLENLKIQMISILKDINVDTYLKFEPILNSNNF